MSDLPQPRRRARVRASLQNPDLPPRTVVALSVTPSADEHVELHSIFSHSRWQLYSARTFFEALAMLSDSRIGVVMSESAFPDGHSWKDLLEEIEKMSNPPSLVVTSRLADDRLWAEVLNLGGYDLLMKPFDAAEVFRTVSLAWMSWKNRWKSAALEPKPAKSADARKTFMMKAKAG
jgi:DNA-binding response OmpR family regulator